MTEAPPRPRQPRPSPRTETTFRSAGRRRQALPAALDPRGPRQGVNAVHTSGAHRFRRVLTVLVSMAVLVASVGGWVSYNYFEGKVAHVTLHLTGKKPPAAAYGTENFLLVGTDSRAGTGGEYGDTPGERSDSTILAHLAKDGTTTMVSFPRDTLVTIPEYRNSSGNTVPAHRGKFNEAISDGGPSLLVSMVQSLTDIKIDHYVSVDLEGFKAMTNAVGGVNVCIKASSFREYVSEDGKVSTNTNDPMSGFLGGPGTSVHLTGDQGLAFVRQRHGLANGDIGRIQRQQQFMGAVFRKALTTGVLTNPLALEKLLSAASSALTLDKNTKLSDLKSLASRLHGLSAGKIKFETLPTHSPTPAEGGDSQGNLGALGSVQLWSQADLDKLVGPLRATPTTGATAGKPATAARPTIPPAQVAVSVFNGTRRTGLAATATTALQAKGFQATKGGDASTHGYEASEIHYSAGSETAANTVAAAVPGAKLVADSSITGVQLILGTNYGTTGTGTGTAATPSTPASTAPAAAPVTATANCTY